MEPPAYPEKHLLRRVAPSVLRGDKIRKGRTLYAILIPNSREGTKYISFLMLRVCALVVQKAAPLPRG